MRFTLVVAFCVSMVMAAQGDDFSVTQVRFSSSTVGAVDVELSRFGTYTALADTTEGNSVRVLDENWELLWRHRQPVYWGGSFRHAPLLQFAPDESFLVLPAYRTENDIALVNPRTGEPIAVLTGHGGTVDCLALSPDGARMVSCAQQEIFLWRRDGASFTLADKLAGHEGSISSVSFSPDGTLAATCETDQMMRRIVVYRVSADRLKAVARCENEDRNLSREYTQVAFSPDGRWLAAGYSDALLVFQRSQDSIRLAQRVPDIELGPVLSVTFSPDGALLLTGHVRDARAWKLVNGSWTPSVTFTPHLGHVRDMQFSIDGTKLALAGGADANALGLWSAKGVGPSPLGGLLSLLQGRISTAQRRFLDDALAQRMLSALAPADAAPRDMFETEAEYAARRGRSQARCAGLLQEETEKRFNAERMPARGTVSAELSVQYGAGGKSWRETISRPIGLLNRNAIRWTDDRKVGAFMTVSDPAFLRFSGRVMGMVDDLATNVLTHSFLSAVRLFASMKAAGVRYVVDPSSAYESLSRDSTAIDFVRFPTETLDARSGDCDDLSVLYNSLLESVGVKTAFITTPGHIFSAFNLDMPPDQASRLFARSEDLIIREGTTWVPVETTMVNDGFMKAWQTAAVEWREATVRDAAGFFTARDAWQTYLPAGFAAAQSTLLPSRDRVVSLFAEEIDAFRAAALGPREAELLGLLATSPSSAQENQLGMLYAQFGLLAKALGRFEKAASGGYLPAMVNAANVYGLQKDHERALEYLKRAQRQDPDNARVLIALAFTYFQAGNEAEAKSTFERMSRIDPTLAARFPLFGSAPATGQARAGRESAAKDLFGGDWVP